MIETRLDTVFICYTASELATRRWHLSAIDHHKVGRLDEEQQLQPTKLAQGSVAETCHTLPRQIGCRAAALNRIQGILHDTDKSLGIFVSGYCFYELALGASAVQKKLFIIASVLSDGAHGKIPLSEDHCNRAVSVSRLVLIHPCHRRSVDRSLSLW